MVKQVLFRHPQIVELEIFTFRRRKLASLVNTLTQVIYNAIIAVKPRFSLDIGNKLRIFILEFTCSRHHQHTLEVNHSFIPAKSNLIQPGKSRRCGFSRNR